MGLGVSQTCALHSGRATGHDVTYPIFVANFHCITSVTDCIVWATSKRISQSNLCRTNARGT